MNGSSLTYTLRRPRLISVTIVTVALTFALPLLFHLLPSVGIPLGARFLPIFFAQQPVTIASNEAWQAFLTSLQVALPGLGMLHLLNLVVVWQKRRNP